MRVWIAVFLLLLFATQAFPVAALGKSYAKAQISVADDSAGDDDEGNSSIPKEGKVKKQNSLSEEDYDHSHHLHAPSSYSLHARNKLLHLHEWIYALYSGEVTTPPPNFG
jgi:hypothetical protein